MIISHKICLGEKGKKILRASRSKLAPPYQILRYVPAQVSSLGVKTLYNKDESSIEAVTRCAEFKEGNEGGNLEHFG